VNANTFNYKQAEETGERERRRRRANKVNRRNEFL